MLLVYYGRITPFWFGGFRIVMVLSPTERMLRTMLLGIIFAYVSLALDPLQVHPCSLKVIGQRIPQRVKMDLLLKQKGLQSAASCSVEESHYHFYKKAIYISFIPKHVDTMFPCGSKVLYLMSEEVIYSFFMHGCIDKGFLAL
nr:hypothetical protein [Tanacetum cinerariifolium]